MQGVARSVCEHSAAAMVKVQTGESALKEFDIKVILDYCWFSLT